MEAVRTAAAVAVVVGIPVEAAAAEVEEAIPMVVGAAAEVEEADTREVGTVAAAVGIDR